MCLCVCVCVQELQKREAILAKKEAMVSEKGELEIKKMRSSTMLNKVRNGLSPAGVEGLERGQGH